jgi:hypothetical protein
MSLGWDNRIIFEVHVSMFGLCRTIWTGYQCLDLIPTITIWFSGNFKWWQKMLSLYLFLRVFNGLFVNSHILFTWFLYCRVHGFHSSGNNGQSTTMNGIWVWQNLVRNVHHITSKLGGEVLDLYLEGIHIYIHISGYGELWIKRLRPYFTQLPFLLCFL